MKIKILILLISVTLSACGGAPVNTVEPLPLNTPVGGSGSACGAPANWTIQYGRSGGITGFNQSLTARSDGSLTIQSENPPADTQKSISQDQVNAITNLLVQACPFNMVPNDAGCADCFIYKLNVQMDGQSYVMLATDVTLTEEVRPLIDVLSQLLQDTGG